MNSQDEHNPETSSDEDAGVSAEGDMLDVDFDFFDPNELDYHGVGELVKGGTWDFVELNFAELADTIVGQGNIGTLIKSDAGGEDEAVCGLLTALNLRQFKHLSWPGAVAKALLAQAERHADAGALRELRSLLEPEQGREVGLLLSERFVNLPLELVPALHGALQEDIQWSCETEQCPKEERCFYFFTHFLAVARCHDGDAPAATPQGRGKRRRRQAPEAGAAGQLLVAGRPLFFPRAEDGAYARRASFSFTFPVSTNSRQAAAVRTSAAPCRPERRIVFGISRSAFQQAITEIRAGLSTEK